jgi:NitT/TauT family transport system permease protein
MIALVDQLFWRPLVAWSDRFRLEQSASADAPQSWVYDIIRTSQAKRVIAVVWTPLGDWTSRRLASLTRVRSRRNAGVAPAWVERAYTLVLAVAVVVLLVAGARFVLASVGIAEVGKVALLGFYTLLRVMVLLAFATLVWTPIGVAIGFNPKLARILQPVALFLASFPANFVFPFATLAFIKLHVSLDYGSVLLMALGSQWYILFNSIAGAQSIPTDLREMAADCNLRGWNRWRRLIVPGIFSSWVTGGITASGGAWNASIVSEIVMWGSSTLTAAGLGAYIAEQTTKGDWPRITLGVATMSLYVVLVNRVLWRRLYALAERKFRL